MIINTQQTQLSKKDTIVAINTQTYNMLKNNFEKVFFLVNGLKGITTTPVDIQKTLDDFGTDGVTLFQTSEKVLELLQFVNPNYVPPTTENTFTFNSDNSVKLG